jgi:DNA-binding response OmpR family regulator
VEVDVSRRRVWVAGELVALTATELDLLAYLIASPGVVRTRHELLVEVWGYRDGSGPRTVDSHVRAVRRKVGPEAIRTVHGIGYAGSDGISD